MSSNATRGTATASTASGATSAKPAIDGQSADTLRARMRKERRLACLERIPPNVKKRHARAACRPRRLPSAFGHAYHARQAHAPPAQVRLLDKSAQIRLAAERSVSGHDGPRPQPRRKLLDEARAEQAAAHGALRSRNGVPARKHERAQTVFPERNRIARVIRRTGLPKPYARPRVQRRRPLLSPWFAPVRKGAARAAPAFVVVLTYSAFSEA